MEWKALVKSVKSCSRAAGDTDSEMVDCILELLNT